ncbi:hypothetical protein LTS15_010521 [Exophiala xenobiotica]|nr:hypothetical protein LTS15_010521 [Exophiala xenobiotica]
MSSVSSTPVHEQSELLNQVEEARSFLKQLSTRKAKFPPGEDPLTYTIPRHSWLTLLCDDKITLWRDIREVRETIKNKIWYNATTSTLRIFPMPLSIHEAVIEWLDELVYRTKAGLNNTSLSGQIHIRHNEEKNCEDGSEKIPDMAIWYDTQNRSQIHTIFEVVSSQSTSYAMEVVAFWLKRFPEVARVVLIDKIESPIYRRPKGWDINQLTNTLEKIRNDEFRCDSNRGLLRCGGYTWVGQLEFTYEVWERDQRTNQPVRRFRATFVHDDNSPLPPSLPFFELPSTFSGNRNVEITPENINYFWHTLLRLAIIREAESRIIKYLGDLRKRAEAARVLEEVGGETREQRQNAKDDRLSRWENRQQQKDSEEGG